jgi:hypothetical protein
MPAIGLAMLVLMLGAQATATAAPAATPCADPEYRQFDFWLGDWDVYGPQGKRAGHNSIGVAEGGCVVVEHWTSASGHTGTSVNFYDRGDRRWHQAWMDQDGDALRLVGDLRDGRMVLQSEAASAASETARNRITWTPLPDGKVRQMWEASADGGKTWKVAFDGTYVKAPTTGGCDGGEFRRLDFWIGTWDVLTPSGEKIGTNRIDRILKGCALQENWAEPAGAEGRSLFYYSTIDTRWKQVWVTDAATELGGLKEKRAVPIDGNGMRFQGELVGAAGRIILDRTTLTPQPDGRVRQTIETSADGGTTWKIQFDAIYTRQPSP